MQQFSLSQINAFSDAEFVQALGDIFERSPDLARALARLRPFASGAAMEGAIAQVLNALPTDAKLAFLRAHPDLGSKAKMAEASVQEQAGAGLDRLSAEEFARFQRLNQAYREQFGIPFIIAVRHHTKASILAAFEERLHNTPEQECARALAEVQTIIGFRLGDRLAPDLPT